MSKKNEDFTREDMACITKVIDDLVRHVPDETPKERWRIKLARFHLDCAYMNIVTQMHEEDDYGEVEGQDDTQGGKEDGATQDKST